MFWARVADTLTSMHKWAPPNMGEFPPPYLLPTGRPSLLTRSKGIKPHCIKKDKFEMYEELSSRIYPCLRNVSVVIFTFCLSLKKNLAEKKLSFFIHWTNKQFCFMNLFRKWPIFSLLHHVLRSGIIFYVI